jgi:hypothetical protein
MSIDISRIIGAVTRSVLHGERDGRPTNIVVATRLYPTDVEDAWDAAERTHAIDEGRAVIERLECTRCHVVDALAPAGRSAHCVSCHVFLDGLAPDDHAYQTIATRYGEATLQRYQRNIEHFRAVLGVRRQTVA